MSTIIKTRLVKIGNSQGIRIPKVLLDQAGLTQDIELEVHADHLLIRPAHRSRDGWEDSFRQMAMNHDDQFIDPEGGTFSSWDAEEWTWE
ncbi:MAG: AbrB/MazE/SpoVT family DNA-binding domain-containing protein [Chloroflexales bacterium]